MRSVVLIVVCFGACLFWACGGGGTASVRPGPMPRSGDFSGVWFSPQYGEMQLVQTGASVMGEYSKNERTGRIQGTAQGDILRFEWDEEREMVSGRTVRTRGRGYFRYSIGEDGEHYILGEWGYDDSETGGGPWRAVKSRTRRPRLSNGPGGAQGSDAYEPEPTPTAPEAGTSP